MKEKKSFAETMKHVWGEISMRDKVLLCAQGALAVGILAVILLDTVGVLPTSIVNVVALSLLVVLLAVSAVRNYPNRKMSVVIYIIFAILVVVMLVTGMVV